MTLKKAEDKLEKLKAKSQALDQMIDSGMLIDCTSNEDRVEKELQSIALQKAVEEDLARLKSRSNSKKRKRILRDEDHREQEEEQESYITG
jgi:phage shock protein A